MRRCQPESRFPEILEQELSLTPTTGPRDYWFTAAKCRRRTLYIWFLSKMDLSLARRGTLSAGKMKAKDRSTCSNTGTTRDRQAAGGVASVM